MAICPSCGSSDCSRTAAGWGQTVLNGAVNGGLKFLIGSIIPPLAGKMHGSIPVTKVEYECNKCGRTFLEDKK